MRAYSLTSGVLSQDFKTLLADDPESFECLIYKATSQQETVAPSVIADVVGSSESSTRKITYADPVISRALIVPDANLQLLSFGAGEGEDTVSGKEPVVILLEEDSVPKQSVVRWTEVDVNDTIKTLDFYILNSEPFGKAPVAGYKHYCIPLLSPGEIG